MERATRSGIGSLFALQLLLLITCPGESNALLRFTISPPGDIYVLAGTDLQINCTMTVEHEETTTITNSTGASTAQPYSVYDIDITNNQIPFPHDVFTFHETELTLEMNLHNVSFIGSTFFLCTYKKQPGKIQTLSLVHVGEPPSPPENLTCISYNNVNMSCSFFVKNKTSALPTNWTMLYRTATPQPMRNCSYLANCSPSSSVPWASYECGRVPTSNFCHKPYVILVTGKNDQYQFQTSHSFNITPDFDIVKPNPVRNLTFNFTGDARVVNLSWLFPEGLVPSIGQMEYKIVMKTSDNQWDHRELIYEEPVVSNMDYMYSLEYDDSSTASSYTIRDLIPYATYTVTVYCKLVKAQGNLYWSKATNANFKTRQTAPLEPPTWAPGSAVILDCAKHLMCVIIYWKNPPAQYWGGKELGYKLNTVAMETTSGENAIKYNIHNDDTKQPILRRHHRRHSGNMRKTEVIHGLQTYTPLNLTFEKTIPTSRLQLQMTNNMGISERSTSLLIPSWSEVERIKAVWVSVQMDKNGALVSWEVGNDVCQDITSVTYYWCTLDHSQSKNITYAVCKDDFDWFTINVTNVCNNQSAKQHWLSTGSDLSSRRYAVAITTGERSGGMVWEMYRYDNVREVPSAPEYSVSVNPRDPTSLDVKLVYIEYPSVIHGGQPQKYEVKYGPENNAPASEQSIKEYSANLTDPVLRIPSLDKGITYSVTVRGINNAGPSRSGEVLTRKIPVNDHTDISMVIGVTVAGVIIIIGLVLSTWFGCRRFKKHKADMSRVIVPAGLCPSKTIEEKYMKIGDGDSGRDTGSSPSNSLQLVNEDQTSYECSSKLNRRHSNASTLSGYNHVGAGAPGNDLYGDESMTLMSGFISIRDSEDQATVGEHNEAFKGSSGGENIEGLGGPCGGEEGSLEISGDEVIQKINGLISPGVTAYIVEKNGEINEQDCSRNTDIYLQNNEIVQHIPSRLPISLNQSSELKFGRITKGDYVDEVKQPAIHGVPKVQNENKPMEYTESMNTTDYNKHIIRNQNHDYQEISDIIKLESPTATSESNHYSLSRPEESNYQVITTNETPSTGEVTEHNNMNTTEVDVSDSRNENGEEMDNETSLTGMITENMNPPEVDVSDTGNETREEMESVNNSGLVSAYSKITSDSKPVEDLVHHQNEIHVTDESSIINGTGEDITDNGADVGEVISVQEVDMFDESTGNGCNENETDETSIEHSGNNSPERRDSFGFSVVLDTDMSHYRNPDSMSLRSSTFSDISSDTISVNSVESAEKQDTVEFDEKNMDRVLKLCKEIKALSANEADLQGNVEIATATENRSTSNGLGKNGYSLGKNHSRIIVPASDSVPPSIIASVDSEPHESGNSNDIANTTSGQCSIFSSGEQTSAGGSKNSAGSQSSVSPYVQAGNQTGSAESIPGTELTSVDKAFKFEHDVGNVTGDFLDRDRHNKSADDINLLTDNCAVETTHL